MKTFNYVVYDKDLGKDITKHCIAKYRGKVQITVQREIPFQVFVPVSVKNPKAIQDDRLLKTKVRKVTDRTYNALLNLIGNEFGKLKYKGILDQPPTAELDRIWTLIQTEAEKAGKQIGKEAEPVIEKYLKARNEGKAASFEFKYKRYKSGLTVVGAAAGTGLAIAGAAAASAATMGAASASLILAVAGGARAVTGAVREYKRQTKELDDIESSINKTLAMLHSSISAQVKKEVGVTAKEVLAKMSSAWLETNIRSIKKLEKDIDLLEAHAQVRVLQASKSATMATQYHEIKKKSSAAHKHAVETLNVAKKLSDPVIKKKIPEMEKEIKQLERTIKAAESARDHITEGAAAERKAARDIIKNKVVDLRRQAADLKKHRHEIGWTAYPINFLPTALDLAVGGGASGNPLANAAEKAEAVQDLAVTAGEALVEVGETIEERFELLKRAFK